MKEGNDETHIAQTAEADMLSLYLAFGTRCESPLDINKFGTTR